LGSDCEYIDMIVHGRESIRRASCRNANSWPALANHRMSRALPSDVRKVCDLPTNSPLEFVGATPQGIAPTNFSTSYRKVRDLPHIGGQSPVTTLPFCNKFPLP
jgi:hypothetical protein